MACALKVVVCEGPPVVNKRVPDLETSDMKDWGCCELRFVACAQR